MGGKGKKRANKAGLSRPQQSGQHKKGNKGQAQPEFSETVVLKGRPGKSVPVPGLSNLGNTCFFNSVMQNLGQSHYFRAELGNLLAKPIYTIELTGIGEPSSRQLTVEGSVGQLTGKLSSFLSQMQTGGRVLNPQPVFSEISKKAPRFSGYHQQDSQELLRCLLDALRSEEITRIKRAILTSYNVAGTKNKKEHLTDSDRADIRAYGLQAHLQTTFVDSAFGGVLTSTVVCNECKNKTTMHETFLDLSLPIANDKSMSSDLSPVGYQTRSKSKKKAEPGKISAPKSRPELSKHQLKKQEKQARKATRTANKKSLNKFLSDDRPSSPTEHSQSVELPPTVNEQENSVNQEETNVKELEIDPTPNECEGLDKDSEATDSKQDGPSVHSTSITEIPATVTVAQPATETSNSNMDMTRRDVDGYAADGPVLDTNSMSALGERGLDLGTATADTQRTNNLEETMEQQQTATMETAQAIEESEPVQAVSSASIESNTTPLAAGPEPESLVRRFQSLNVYPDSLEASLKKFCTPELLTGANKFACVVCTKLKYEGQSVSNKPPNEEDTTKNEAMCDKVIEKEVPSDSNSRDECMLPEVKVDTQEKTVEDITNKSSSQQSSVSDVVADVADNMLPAEDDSAVDIVADDERQEGTDSRGNEDNDGRADSGDEASAPGNEDSFEQSADADNEESSEEELPKPKPMPTSSISFCEATKQMLVEKAPPILTLHLKRFIQHGRRLQKNNKYLSFPALLDMSPFCVRTGQVDTDGGAPSNQLLYSLYGIVEHSGSMQGGHYIAYVKLRTPPKSTNTPPSSAKDLPKENSSVNPNEDSTTMTEDCVSSPLTEVKPDDIICPKDGVECIVDPKCTLNLDLSSTKGQWYYISDSHVRTASESEVMKSQAYLLFYEKLPHY